MAFTHGVYVQELDTKILGVRTCDSALPFVVGIAPVQSLDKDKRPINEPKLIFNLKEYQSTFGALYGDEKESDYTLTQFAKVYFSLYGVSPAVFVNVLDPDKHNSQNTETVTFDDNDEAVLKYAGVWDITVKSPDGNTEYKENDDYTVDYAKGIISRADGSAIGAGAQVSVSYTYADPSKVTKDDIIGGVDAETNQRTGLELIEEIFPRFGKVIGTIVIPKFSTDTTVANAMIAKAENINNHFKAMAYIDVPATKVTSTDAVQWKQTFGSPHAVVFFPSVRYDDMEQPLSIHAAGLTAKVDADNTGVPYESPSNKLVFIDAPSKIFTLQEANYLNEQGITTVFRMMTGWKLWGNRTAAFPANTDIKDSFIPNRRMANWIENNLILLTWQKVDDPMNKRLIETVVSTVNIWLNGLRGRGFLIGAKVMFREEDNPLTDLANGIIRFYITYLAPPPAETIEYVLEVDVNYFKNLFGGE